MSKIIKLYTLNMCSLFQVSSVLCNYMSIPFYSIVCQSNFYSIASQFYSILLFVKSILKKSRGWAEVSAWQIISQMLENFIFRLNSEEQSPKSSCKLAR